MIKVAAVSALSLFASVAFAGVDVTGHITGVQMMPEGLYFATDIANITTYCAIRWNGMNMFVPASDPNFPYYYGLVMTAYSKSRTIYLGNISFFNGTTQCDLTKTGYGIVSF